MITVEIAAPFGRLRAPGGIADGDCGFLTSVAGLVKNAPVLSDSPRQAIAAGNVAETAPGA